MAVPETSPRRDRLSPLSMLSELTYPEYRSRHLFTARLRLLIFIGFWFFYIFWFDNRGVTATPIMMIVMGSFVMTAICYYNIIYDRWLILSFLFEVVADMVGITVVVYVTGGPDSEYYYLYVLYCLAAGLFYSYRTAIWTAVASFVTYACYLGCATAGWLPLWDPTARGSPEQIVAHHLHHPHPAWAAPEWGHPPLLAVLLFFAVYAVKIAQSFTQLRERMLEARNRELVALQQIGGTVRSAEPLEDVIDRVLQGVLRGLNFTMCVLMLYDRPSRRIVCYPPRHRRETTQAEMILGHPFRELSLPVESPDNPLFKQLAEKRVLFRREFDELFAGMEPAIAPATMQRLQQGLGFRKAVAIPLVAEREVLGALIGFSQEAFVGERVVQTLETFANQGALALQTTLLIEELKAKNRQLEEANRVKSEFLATMSHELRTPLTAIIGFSELLLEGVMGELSIEQQDSLREVLNNGANLLGLINNLLDLSKMESGKLTLNYERFDLRQLLDRTLGSLRSLIQRKHLQFTSLFPEELPPIEADERRIQQVALNLLGNAIKFTPERGAIHLEVSYVASLEGLPHRAWREHITDPRVFASGCFALLVRDTGIGIPPTHVRSVFEMFRQVDSSVTRSYEGTGLGLALVKQLVELHHGVIWAESQASDGATFICLVPAQPVAPPSEAPSDATTTPTTVRHAIHSIRVPV